MGAHDKRLETSLSQCPCSPCPPPQSNLISRGGGPEEHFYSNPDDFKLQSKKKKKPNCNQGAGPVPLSIKGLNGQMLMLTHPFLKGKQNIGK